MKTKSAVPFAGALLLSTLSYQFSTYSCFVQGSLNPGTGLSAALGNSCLGEISGGTAFIVTYNVNTYDY